MRQSLILISGLLLSTHNGLAIPLASCKSKTISLTNKINNAMLQKSYLLMSFSPDLFAISINGKLLEPNQTVDTQIDNDTVIVRYSYSFAKGFYKGTNDVLFKLKNPNQKKFTITFSWDNKFRLIIPDMIPQKKIPAYL
jgi:hypothetical protein